MESIGEKLKITRESRKLTVKAVSLDTNISPTYIEALEDEDFEKFPSETYVVGFLKTYAEFLKLDSSEIVQLYKGYKIGESATPIEELTRPTKSPLLINFAVFYNQYKNIFFFMAVALLSLLVAWGIWSVTKSDVTVDNNDSVSQIKQDYEEKQDSRITNIRNLQLSNERGFTLVYKGEAVQFLVENKEVVFLLKEIGENSVVLSFINESKEVTLKLGSETSVELEGCARELLLSLKGLTESRAKVMIVLGKNFTAVKEAASTENSNVQPLQEGDNTRVIAQNNKSLKIVFEVKFVKKSFIEIYLDGNRKQRGFMPAGSKERWEASEYIQVKIGNAGGIDGTINGKSYKFGKSGQVANKIITWKKDVKNPNLYSIQVKDW